jgi:hypothetical protein
MNQLETQLKRVHLYVRDRNEATSGIDGVSNLLHANEQMREANPIGYAKLKAMLNKSVAYFKTTRA